MSVKLTIICSKGSTAHSSLASPVDASPPHSSSFYKGARQDLQGYVNSGGTKISSAS